MRHAEGWLRGLVRDLEGEGVALLHVVGALDLAATLLVLWRIFT